MVAAEAAEAEAAAAAAEAAAALPLSKLKRGRKGTGPSVMNPMANQAAPHNADVEQDSAQE